MSIAAIPELLTNALVPQMTATGNNNVSAVDPGKEAHFKDLMNSPQVSAENMLGAQNVLNEWAISADLTAKVAGAFAQGINKLTELQ